MPVPSSTGSSSNSRYMRAPREAVYSAFVDPEALAVCVPPEGMTGQLHEFDATVGGGYWMSLFYADDVEGGPGKTGDREEGGTASRNPGEKP